MLRHIALIKDPKLFAKFYEKDFGKGILATFGIHKKTGKELLQQLSFDPGEYEFKAAADFGRKFKAKTFTEGMDIPSEIMIEADAANLELLAAEPYPENPEEEPLRKFRMVAYTGKKMVTSTIPTPLVVDLDGLDMQAGKSLPILMDHKTTQRVGHSTNIVVSNGELLAEGIMSAATKFTREVAESSDNGYPWQASIGATILKAKYLNAKSSQVVNGKAVQGPALVVAKSVLREISFVSIGADDDTSAVAASAASQKEIDMGFEQWLKAKGFDKDSLSASALTSLKAMYDEEMGAENDDDAGDSNDINAGGDVDVDGAVGTAIKAERKRIADIREACNGEFPEIQAEAEANGWDLGETNRAVLKAMREKRPNINTGLGKPESGDMKVVEAALGLRAGLDAEDLEKDLGEKAVVEAHAERGISLRDVMAAAMASEGVSVPRTFGNEFIRAALSTVSLPGILSNTANKRMLKAYQLQNITATRVCSEGDLADFKQSNRYRLNELGGFDEVGATGELKHGTLGEDSAVNQLSTYGKMITLSRQMIINDDLSALTKIPAAMAARAAQKVDELFYTRLLSNPTFTDGVSLFDASTHKNYQSGAGTVLSVDSMDAASQLFRNQTDKDGKPINVSPRTLLVPTSLEFTASQLVNSVALTAYGATDTDNVLTSNPVTQMGLQVVSSPWLNAQGLTGSSSTGWYLFGDPSVVDTFEIGYLRGARTPTLERVDLPSDMLGMGWRIYFDLGIREQDFRGMVLSKGAA